MLGLYDHLQYGVGQPTQAEVQAALAKLPRCFSQELDRCADEFQAARAGNRAPALTTTCTADMYAVYQQPELWRAALDALPYCPQPAGDNFRLPSCYSRELDNAVDALPFCPVSSTTVIVRPITSPAASTGGAARGGSMLLVAGVLAVVAVGAFLVLRGRAPARA